MPFIDLVASKISDRTRLFSQIDELGDPHTALTEKIEDLPIVLEWYKTTGFSDSQIEEISQLRKKYRPLTALFLNDESIALDGRFLNHRNINNEKLWYEGRGIYHDLGDLFIYIKGLGDIAKLIRKPSHRYPGFPDSAESINFIEDDRPVGTMNLQEAEMEFICGLSLLQRMMKLHNLSSIAEAIKAGYVIPLAISKYKELSGSLNKMTRGSDWEKEKDSEYASIMSIVPSQTRLESVRPRLLHGGNEPVVQKISEMWETYTHNSGEIWSSIGNRLKDMLNCSLWIEPGAFHSQNMYIDINNPDKCFTSDSGSLLDLSELEPYQIVHFLAYSLMRHDSIMPDQSPYLADKLSQHDFEAYFTALLPLGTSPDVIKSLPSMMLTFRPIISFAIAEILLEEFSSKSISSEQKFEKILPIDLYQNYKEYLEKLQKNELPQDFVDIQNRSPWLGNNYYFIELFINWIKTGSSTKIMQDPLIGELFRASIDGSIKKIESNSTNLGDTYDLTQISQMYGIGGFPHKFFEIIPLVNSRVKSLIKTIN